ncbi:MAG: HEAT repeat domain-containing protein [Bryobacteraceae bacterium]|jgi:hypothetical protein
METSIAPLLIGFSDRKSSAKDELKMYAESDPKAFREESLPLILSEETELGARRYLVNLLFKYAGMFEYLIDPARCNPEQACSLAKTVVGLGVPLDTALESALSNSVRDAAAGARLVRVLELLSTLSLGKHIVRYQEQLIVHADLNVRAKTAFEVGKFSKSPSWVTRMLMNGDPKVQASAVEALWGFGDENVKPVLLIAARSPYPGVAANGLLGLYRRGALDSIPQLLRMAVHPEDAHRAEAIWAIGETGDPRFLPYLTREYAKAEPKEKQRFIRALSRIRKQIPTPSETVEVRTAVLEARRMEDSSRRMVVALWSNGGDISSLTPTQFGMWENEELVTDYSARCIASPPKLILGFALPRFTSKSDPYAQAVERGLSACADLKRARDMWRVERYLLETSSEAAQEVPSLFSKDERSKLTLHMKDNRGFVRDTDLIRKLFTDCGPRETALRDVTKSIEKLVDVASSAAGLRHLFVFFDPAAADENKVQRFTDTLRGEPLTLHGFGRESDHDDKPLRELCAVTNGGSYECVPLERLPDLITETYLGLIDRYEIVYKPETPAPEVGKCELRIWTPYGCSEAQVQFA